MKVQKKRNPNRIIVGAILLIVLFIATGFFDSKGRLIEESYVVKKGDTFWTISEEYLKKNTGGRMYLMKFQDNIKELNPSLEGNHCQVQPGQKLRIQYWIKEGVE